MKLIEIAERTWDLTREQIISRKCPGDLGKRYYKYQNTQKPECDQPGACLYCWEQDTKCKYSDICPSASGWCNNSVPDEKCIDFILNAYNRYAQIGLTPEQIQKVDDLYREKCEEVAELRRRLDEQSTDMGKNIRGDKQPKSTKAQKGENQSETRRPGDYIPPRLKPRRENKNGVEEVYIRQKISIHPFVKGRTRFLGKFRKH